MGVSLKVSFQYGQIWELKNYWLKQCNIFHPLTESELFLIATENKEENID